MREIFDVYIKNAGTQKNTRLTLPATPYQLMDAVDRLCLREEDAIQTEVRRYRDFKFLEHCGQENPSVFELNLLAQKLTELDNTERTAFRGLVQMETGDIPISRLIDLAYSTDCCHVVDDVLNDHQLGEFCAESGFVPGTDDLPDKIFQLLDFEKIGKEHRQLEGGVLTPQGYVERHSDIHEMFQTLTAIPKVPEYTIQLELSKGFFNDPSYDSDKTVLLDLPATAAEISQTLGELDVSSWREVGIKCTDCVVPALIDMLDDVDDIAEILQLADRLKTMGPDNRLKYKALLEAVDCRSIDTALALTDALDQYCFSPQLGSPAEVGIDNLRCVLDESEMELLLPYLDLHGYGRKLIAAQDSALTAYGLLERIDGQPVQLPKEQEGGMTFA